MGNVLTDGSTPVEVFAAVESLPTPCAVALDPHCNDVRLNRAFRELLDDGECALPAQSLGLRRAIELKSHIDEVLLDAPCHDGRTLRFIGSSNPIMDSSGEIRGAVAIFTKLADTYGRAADRVRFLARAGARLAESLDTEQIYQTLADILIPRFADCVSVATLDPQKGFRLAFLRDADPAREMQILQVRKRLAQRHAVLPPVGGLLDGEQSRFTNDMRQAARALTDPVERQLLRRLADELQLERAIAVPMKNRGRMVGALTVFGDAQRYYGQEDVDVLEEIARRAASAIDNARAFQQARHIAEAFQQALLPPSLPKVPEFAFDAYYAASDDEARVGGDWYDAVELLDGRIAVSIGDVTGRGLQAAIVMSKVRQAIGTLALSNPEPTSVLDAADFELRRLYPDTIVTAFVGIFDPKANTLSYATAGHPPPFLLTADGALLQMPGHGLPVGLRSDREPAALKWYLQKDARLVFYTDGLLESTHDFFEGERRVTQALLESVRTHERPTAESLCRAVLYDGSGDDVAVMIVDVNRSPGRTLHWHFDATDARIAHDLRGTFLSYLRQRGHPESDYTGAELVIGELIGNVCRHAPGEVDIDLDWRGENPVMHLIDRGGGYEAYRVLPVDPYSETGRGLFLVQSAAKDLAVTRLPGYGSHTRAVLNVARR